MSPEKLGEQRASGSGCHDALCPLDCCVAFYNGPICLEFDTVQMMMCMVEERALWPGRRAIKNWRLADCLDPGFAASQLNSVSSVTSSVLLCELRTLLALQAPFFKTLREAQKIKGLVCSLSV